jgi:hypothetical protein
MSEPMPTVSVASVIASGPAVPDVAVPGTEAPVAPDVGAADEPDASVVAAAAVVADDPAVVGGAVDVELLSLEHAAAISPNAAKPATSRARRDRIIGPPPHDGTAIDANRHRSVHRCPKPPGSDDSGP